MDPTDAVVSYDSTAAKGSAANPNHPEGLISKWIRTPDPYISFNTSAYKCYIINGMAFRLRFPNNYNPANASKYPVVVFFHGGGEYGNIYDNDKPLINGAQLFEQKINNGDWNGFLLFPQNQGVNWYDYYYSRVNIVLDTLAKYNNIDPDRVISMGLSAGGYGCVSYASLYPQRVAAIIPSVPAGVRTLSGTISTFVHVPIWLSNGGQDPNPDPTTAGGFCLDFRNAGGNIYQTYYVNQGHSTWTSQWLQQNAAGNVILNDYWNNAHKAQPLVYFQNQQFCSGAPIAARMGLTAGYYAYQWQKDGIIISGATGNEYTATQAGQYKARFMRDGNTGVWSAWSPAPVVISTKSCTTDTVFAEHFNTDSSFVSEPEYNRFNYTCQNGIVITGTDSITQDAAGNQGKRFLANFTFANSGCTYTSGDRVWNTYTPVVVLPNTNYEYTFYLANQNSTNPAQITPAINGTALTTTQAQIFGVGNTSWKKFSYLWNSGASTSADLSLKNNNINTSGNDFAIDEITLKLAGPPPSCTANISPANGTTINTSLRATLKWASVASAYTYDVYLWTGATAPITPTYNVTDTVLNVIGLSGSSLYNWYVVPRNASPATGCSSNKTSFTTAVAPMPGNGTGLKADYFNNNALSGNPVLSRIDTTVNFSWLTGSPDPSINADYFSTRWTGQIQPLFSETYIFTTTSDDAIRLWVNGQLIINDWNDHAPVVDTASIALTAGVKYDIKIEYHESTGGATAILQWSSLSTPLAVVPKTQLYPPITLPACAVNTTPVTNSIISTQTTATLSWGAVATAVSYDVYLWKGTVAPTTPTATVVTNSYTASGLTAATQYSWYAVPKNASGAASGCAGSGTTTFTTAAAPIVGTGTGLKADYFNNNALTGSIVSSRTDTTVNFNWLTGSPAASINADYFSARWTGQVQAQFSEKYTFVTTSDDGIRLYVNGQLLINDWNDHASVTDTASIILAAGVKYNIKIEYHESTGNATAILAWSSPSTPPVVIPKSQLYPPVATAPVIGNGTGLAAVYFNNNALTGTPVLSRTDTTVNFNWGSGSPAATINADYFSARWTGQVQAQFSEKYTFTSISDDGIRLWVNGQLLINDWNDHAPVTDTASITLVAGVKYDIKIEYHESTGGATAILSWSSTSTPLVIIPKSQLYPAAVVQVSGTGLQGDYFNNKYLTGTPVLSRTDTTVNFNWGSGSPAPSVNVDSFSARWTGQVLAQYSETYTFGTYSDDGVRFWVNGVQIINNWTDHGPTNNTATVTLSAGVKYDIKMEYYEATGGATAVLGWSSASTAAGPIPKSQLFPPAVASASRVMAQDAQQMVTTIAAPAANVNALKTGVYPNPVSRGQLATLQLNSADGGTAIVQVVSMTGNLLQNQQLSIIAGSNTRKLSTAGMQPGFYIIRISGNVDKPAILKLVIF